MTVSQTAAWILAVWTKDWDKPTDDVARPLAAHLETLAKWTEGWDEFTGEDRADHRVPEDQAHLRRREGARLAAVTSIRQTAEKNDPWASKP